MRLINQLIRSFLSLLLIAIFGMGGAGAAPGDWTRINYPVAAQELSVQPVSLTNTARAPPTASANVMATCARAERRPARFGWRGSHRGGLCVAAVRYCHKGGSGKATS
jgi:hypothetical protein